MWEKPRVDGRKKLKCNAMHTIFTYKDNTIITASPSVSDNEMVSNFSNVSVILY